MQAKRSRIYHRLQIVAHRMQKVGDREIARNVKLTTTQAAVLSVLRSGEGDTQKQIALALGLNESAVTDMINRLIRYGYIGRKRSQQDRRSWVLHVTTDGEAAHDAAGEGFRQLNESIHAALSDREIVHLADMLDRLADAFTSE